MDPPHMAVRRQDDQHEHTFSSYVRIRDVVLKTCLGRWTIGRSGERGSGISVLPARHDDDDIYIYIYTYIYSQIPYIYIYIYIYEEKYVKKKKIWNWRFGNYKYLECHCLIFKGVPLKSLLWVFKRLGIFLSVCFLTGFNLLEVC